MCLKCPGIRPPILCYTLQIVVGRIVVLLCITIELALEVGVLQHSNLAFFFANRKYSFVKVIDFIVLFLFRCLLRRDIKQIYQAFSSKV